MNRFGYNLNHETLCINNMGEMKDHIRIICFKLNLDIRQGWIWLKIAYIHHTIFKRSPNSRLIELYPTPE